MLKKLRNVCMFIGYGRSGHSLVASLLDAHENALITHELHVLRLIAQGLDQQAIYQAMLHFADESSRRRKKWTGYSYIIDDSWQGKYRDLRVIGDKKGAGTNVFLMKDPALLDRLIEMFDEKLKLIHVIRNPYDNISSIYMSFKGNRDGPMDRVIRSYFDKVANVYHVKTDGRIPVYDVYLERLIDSPQRTITGLCDFLSLECSEHFLEQCTPLIFTEPRKTRLTVAWSASQIAYVARQIEKFDFLKGYTYDH